MRIGWICLGLLACNSCVKWSPKDYLKRAPGLHELSITNNTEWICEIELTAVNAHSVRESALPVDLRSFLLPGASHRFDVLPDTYDLKVFEREFGRAYQAKKWKCAADTHSELTIGESAGER